MSPSGAAAETEIASIAFHSLAQAPASQVIFSNVSGSLDAGTLILAAATTLVNAPEKGIAVDASMLEEARSALGQG